MRWIFISPGVKDIASCILSFKQVCKLFYNTIRLQCINTHLILVGTFKGMCWGNLLLMFLLIHTIPYTILDIHKLWNKTVQVNMNNHFPLRPLFLRLSSYCPLVLSMSCSLNVTPTLCWSIIPPVSHCSDSCPCL